MVVYNYSGKEINAKIVYYGPALSGKTTNLEWIYSKIPLEYSGKMISLRTQTDRTIFFDFLPLELGLIDGFKTRFMLYTVPGQVYYNATRKMVLKGADGVVFVADSEEGRMADNLESFQNLRDNLVEIGIDPDSIPIVLQWNKRDLPATEELTTLERQMNPAGHPSFSGCALTGEGVYETLHQISRLIYRKLTAEEGASPRPTGAAIDENSLFGADIAERLQDIDVVDPTWEDSISVDPLAAVPASPPQEGALLDTILGSLGAATQEANAAAVAELAPPTEGSAAVTVPPTDPEPLSPRAGNSDRGFASASFEFPEPMSESVSDVARTQAIAPSMEERASLALSENGGRPTMSDRPAPTPPPSAPAVTPQAQPQAAPAQVPVAAPVATETAVPRQAPPVPAPPAQAVQPSAPVQASQASARPDPGSRGNAVPGAADEAVTNLVDTLFTEKEPEPDPEEDGLAYGSDFGRMVDLEPDPAAGKTPPTEADFELPTDLLESGQFTPVVGQEAPTFDTVEEEDGVEPLELIVDPLKSRAEQESGAATGSTPSSGGATGPFQPLNSGTRTIEVPVSVDADLLADGKTLRLVLNLKMRS